MENTGVQSTAPGSSEKKTTHSWFYIYISEQAHFDS